MVRAPEARSASRPRWRLSIASGTGGGLLGLLFVLTALLPAPAALAVVPHVSTTPETDTCAMCHRTHTAASPVQYRDKDSGEAIDTALIIGTYETDVELCYVCHGVANLGSDQDVQTDFDKASSHVLTPDTSAYGPIPKGCSDCHDSHGSAKDGEGNTLPSLLRSYDADGEAVGSGDEYCATCHEDRPADRWDGIDVWRGSAHSGLPESSSGTRIVCSTCHVAHGSDNPPNIVESLYPPAVDSTAAVPANDRRLCLECHPDDDGTTWGGAGLYAGSSHGSSQVTAAVEGEWPDAGDARLVGECQTCHAPMGSSDGAGGVVPKLAEKAGRALCDDCHDADGPASADLASHVPTASTDAYKELAVTFQPGAARGSYGRLSLYSQETTLAASRLLLPVREFGARDAAIDPAGPAAGYAAAAFGGDTQGDGKPDLVVADPDEAQLRFLSSDPLTGLVERTHALASGRPPADFIAVGDFLLDAGASLEIAVVSSDATTDAAQAYLYRERIQSGTTVLDEVAGPIDVGRGATGVAVGDVLSSGVEELVVTAGTDGDFYVLRDASGSWTADGPHSAGGALPRGASIGDAWPGGTSDEIVLLRDGGPGEIAVFGGDGTLKGTEAVGGYSGEASATAVGDVLSGVAGDEVVVAVDAGSGTGGIVVFPQDATGLDGAASQAYETGAGDRSAALAAGQLDGDAASELVVGNAGWRQAGSTGWVSASVQVFHQNGDGTALSGFQRRWAGGTELSGGAPSLVIADLGRVGVSRHPVGAVPGAHVSTEAPDPDPIARHVECADCHNVHEATSTPSAADATAPQVYGRLKGAWGVRVDNQSPGVIEFTELQGVGDEYELCLKCHSAWSESAGGRDIASELATTNASFHGVEAAPGASMPSGAFVTADPAWSGDSRLYCADCHADSDATRADGPHVSDQAPILRRPYLGTKPSDAQLLCYVCHEQETYEAGGGSVEGTDFRSSNVENLHVSHSGDQGLGCGSCHAGHGSTDSIRLLRADIGFTEVGSGGTCDGACHPGAQSQSYAH